MEQKIKCPYCAHLFYLRDAEVIQAKDNNPNIISGSKPGEFIICPSCNAWLDKNYLKFDNNGNKM